jgi:methylmalonyl-CoA mutase N-terminal domain/subunit
VGVNKFKAKETEIPDIQEIDKIAVQKQLERLNNLKQNRENDKVDSGLKALKETAENNGNLIPKIINSVKNHTTLGEISDTLREVFGEF